MGDASDASRNTRRRTGSPGQFVASSSLMGHTLPEGTRIGGLEIVGLVGEGGFGIVYLAYDESLEREVAVKEYMPSSLAARASGSLEVTVKSQRHLETFNAGLRSFVNEARLLARFDHPSLLKVYRFWEANGTAYMAMPYYEGLTLKATLQEMRRPPDEERLREWLAPLLDALAVMHEARCFHRDIAPDNILLTRDGPVLLDFGAARRVIGDMTHALTVVLKPGYAPIEQYGDTPAMQQGAWTDLYALACVVYYAITGRTPISSVERMMAGDALEPLSRVAAGRYSESFLRAVDKALAIQPKERPQDVAQFRALMDDVRPAAPRPVTVFDDETLPPAVQRPPVTTPPRVTATPRVATPPAPPAPLPVVAAAEADGEDTTPRLAWIAAVGSIVAAGVAVWLIVRPVAIPSLPPAAATAALPAPAAPASPPVVPAASPATVLVEPPPAPPAAVLIEPLPAPKAAVPIEPAPAPTAKTDDAALPATTTSGTRDPALPSIAASAAAVLGLPVAVERAPHPPAPSARRATRVSAAPPPTMRPRPARCSDILQKASLEPLTAEEAAFLRRECR